MVGKIETGYIEKAKHYTASIPRCAKNLLYISKNSKTVKLNESVLREIVRLSELITKI